MSGYCVRAGGGRGKGGKGVSLMDFSETSASPPPLYLHMPRRNRCLLPGLPCHITQRGVDRRETFSSHHDRLTYLRLVKENLEDAQTRVLAYCLMTNHIHLIVVPGREDSLAVLLRRVHGRYAQYYNTRCGRFGHLWQNRFFACVLQHDQGRLCRTWREIRFARPSCRAPAITLGRAPLLT